MLSYFRALEKFKIFLTRHQVPNTLPVPQFYVCLYAAHLGSQDYAHGTIKAELAAIAWNHRINGFQDPTTSLYLDRLLTGVKRSRTVKPELEPIDRDLLHILCNITYNVFSSVFEQCITRAILLLMYYACLRVGEATKSGSTEHTLKLCNVSFNNILPKSIEIKLTSYKHSKEPKKFTLRPSGGKHCPVQALNDYLSVRGTGEDTFFNDVRGKTVTRKFVADKIKLLVGIAGLDPSRFNTHSLRIGRTTDLAKEGVPEAVIKETGRWDSEAYRRYIRFPAFTLPH